jgi:hypothetical protein
MHRIGRLIVIAAFALLGFGLPNLANAHAYDLDCWQIGNWYAANDLYWHNIQEAGWDWMHLDEDGDGLPCECLYYGFSCWTPWG